MPLILSLDVASLEILEVKLMDSYKITREFPGKLLPAQQSNLAFEIPRYFKSKIRLLCR